MWGPRFGVTMDEILQEEMSRVYRQNLWGSKESRSGRGSSPIQTMYLEHEVPMLFDRMEIDSLLDIPCGDFRWMSKVLERSSRKINYHGADIVENIIKTNKQKETDSIHFSCLDITTDPLPKVDLVFSRDCFVHLSDSMILKAFKNIKDSGSAYIAMTNFSWFHLPNKALENEDIVGGNWRKINFRMRPFYMPSPIDFISEGSTEELGKDKTIGVWRVSDLPDCLTLE